MPVEPQTLAPTVLGVDVGGTKILVGTVDQSGRVHRSQRYPMRRATAEETLASIHAAIADFLRTLAPEPILAVGVGLGGLADSSAGVWMHSMNMHIRTPVPLAAQILARHGLPAYLDNDVHAATTAELRFGAGRSASEFIYLNVGTGIAAGVVTHGRLVRGASNYAGEIGHLVVEPAGVPCMCGQRGCLEPTASGGGIVEQATARALADAASLLHVGALAGTLTAHDVFAAADAGDPAAGDIAGRAMRALGNTLVGLVNLLNPELVVVGGGVFGDGWLLPRLRDHVTTYALRNAVRALRGIIPSELSIDQVGLLGAASLAWERQP